METGELILLIFFVHIVSGIACAVIALERGVKPGGWFFLGFLFRLSAEFTGGPFCLDRIT